MAQEPALRVTCWGTRGSIASPGPATAHIGGNTPCLEICSADGHRMVFDAGTGIRQLGRSIVANGQSLQLDLFLTHFHWDHIQGIPFFAPLYESEARLRILAARQDDVDIRTLFAGQMGPIYFPVPFEAIAADLEFLHIGESAVQLENGVEVAAIRVRHPATTLGYRVRRSGATIVYIPDNDLGDDPDVPYHRPEGWYSRLVEFIAGADVLFHDAMFTEDEYQGRKGWGHSTYAQAVRLADDAGVKRLRWFHHAPERSDEELLRIVEAQRKALARRGSSLEVSPAAEREEILVQEHVT